MISTCFLLQLLGFRLWYLASPQLKLQPVVGYQAYISRRPRHARLAGSALLLLAAALLVLRLGPMTGLCAALVGLMGVGGLVVALAPFRYLSEYAVLLLYAVFLSLELLF